MRADFRAFFQNNDCRVGIILLQPDRSRQTRRTRADDHDIIFHALALGARIGICESGGRVVEIIHCRSYALAVVGLVAYS